MMMKKAPNYLVRQKEEVQGEESMTTLVHCSHTSISRRHSVQMYTHTFTFFLTLCYCRLSLNRPFLSSYFPLLCLPSLAHPAGFFFCNLSYYSLQMFNK